MCACANAHAMPSGSGCPPKRNEQNVPFAAPSASAKRSPLTAGGLRGPRASSLSIGVCAGLCPNGLAMRGAGRRADALWPLCYDRRAHRQISKVRPVTHAKWGRGLKALVAGSAQGLGQTRQAVQPLVVPSSSHSRLSSGSERPLATPRSRLSERQGIFQYIAWAVRNGAKDYRDVKTLTGL